MATAFTPEQADSAAELLQHLRSKGDGSGSAEIADGARQILTAQVRRYALAANAARAASQILLPLLPGDDELDGAPVFATFADAQTYYLDNADGIYETLIEASLYGADEHSSRVVRGFEQVMTTVHHTGRRVELAELALTSARRHHDELAEAHALMNRGGGHKMAERPAQAVEDYRRAARLFGKHDDAVGMLTALSRLAVAHAEGRQLDEADDTLDQVLALRGPGDEVLAGLVYVNRAWVCTQRGAFDKAIEDGLTGLHALRACGAAPVWLVEAHLGLAKAHTRAGDFERAREHLTAVNERLSDEAENLPQRIAVALAEGELLLGQGHHTGALASFQRAVMIQAAGPDPYRIADALDGAGNALAGLRDFTNAAERHASALRVRLRKGELFGIACTRFYLAKAKSASGHNGEASHQRGQALLDLAGLVDPAADALRAELNHLSL
jgi:tetratricopeptide (TPR) repeat protein